MLPGQRQSPTDAMSQFVYAARPWLAQRLSRPPPSEVGASGNSRNNLAGNRSLYLIISSYRPDSMSIPDSAAEGGASHLKADSLENENDVSPAKRWQAFDFAALAKISCLSRKCPQPEEDRRQKTIVCPTGLTNSHPTGQHPRPSSTRDAPESRPVQSDTVGGVAGPGPHSATLEFSPTS